MPQKSGEGESRRYKESDSVPQPGDSRFVFGAFWAISFVFTFLVAGPWAGFHGALLGCVGLLVALRPPVVAMPRSWWLLAAAFMVAGASSFLPASWIEQPGWRKLFEEAGIATGSMIVIQARQAAEALALFGITLFVGLWLAGHRPSSSQLRMWSLTFTIGVAVYAVVARVVQQNALPGADTHFGFFPNRNHSATYLAMGSICGLGCVLQALREKRFPALAVAILATGICLWAVAAWSISRAGVALVAVGAILWLSMLGRRYLGRHGLWAIGLVTLAAGGMFLIADSGVKQRISKTAEKAGSIMVPADGLGVGEGKSDNSSLQDLDFRIPTALDTLELIRDFNWTGVGAGQFEPIFPQYRKLTAAANDSRSYHPESDWLMMAAEVGVPATLALLALVTAALWKSLRSILQGRDRALRGACLVAAMLVPIHGIFDVPGHRITLALGALLLFSLSMRATSATEQLCRKPDAWPFRVAGLIILAASVFLVRAQWWDGTPPALTVAKSSMAEVRRLYLQDQALKEEGLSETSGEIHSSAPGVDLVETALASLDQAERLAPLDWGIRRNRGFLALHFDDKQQMVRKSFQIERLLDPTWVQAPLQQALLWSTTDVEETANLWAEAIRRARWMDHHHPGSLWSEARTRERIREQVRGKTVLEQLWRDRSGD